MSTKTVKHVDEETWRRLKMLSAEEDVKMGELIKNMADSYLKSKERVWEKILEGKRILSEREAKELQKAVKKLRKERGFR